MRKDCRRHKLLLWVVLFVVMIAVAGCGAGSTARDSATQGPASEAPVPGKGDMGSAPASSTPAEAPAISVVLASEVQDRQVIHNAEVYLDVKDLDVAQQAALKIVEEAGGYLSESNRSRRSDNQEWASLVFRVPADQFDSVIPKLEELGMVTNDRTWTDDVTEEYIDLTAAIENLRAQEQRLRELIQQASGVEDVLRIEQELTRVRQDIDSRTGRLRFLQDRVAYSTINLRLTENILANPTISATGVAGIGPRSRVAFVRAVNAMLQFTANLIVFLVGAIPVVLWITIVGGVLWFLFRKLRPRLPGFRAGRSRQLNSNEQSTSVDA